MSILSTPLNNAQRDAKAQGLDELSRAELFEVAAAMFGYMQYRLMKPNLLRLEALIRRADAAVVLHEENARQRAQRLLAANGCNKPVARQYVQIVAAHLAALPIGRIYRDDGAFLMYHLDPVVPDLFLSALVTNPSVAREHRKIKGQCTECVPDVVEEWGADLWRAPDHYRVLIQSLLCPRGADGQADDQEYLRTNSVAYFQKLDRAVLSIHPEFEEVRAEAIRSHGGRGGDPIL